MIKKNFMLPVAFIIATGLMALIVGGMFLLVANGVINSVVINVAMDGLLLGCVTFTVAVALFVLKVIDLAFRRLANHETA